MSKENKLRYSDEELEEFKALILDKLENAKSELNYMRQQIVEINEDGGDQQGGDYMDDSSTHAELEMLNQMVARQQQFIRNLEHALVRIKNKIYGVCMITGQLIDKNRLKLVPHATKSIAGKQGLSNPAPKIKAVKTTTRKDKPAKIITKVVRKPTNETITKESILVDSDWDDDDDDNEIPDYENPLMELDLDNLEDVDTSEEE